MDIAEEDTVAADIVEGGIERDDPALDNWGSLRHIAAASARDIAVASARDIAAAFWPLRCNFSPEAAHIAGLLFVAAFAGAPATIAAFIREAMSLSLRKEEEAVKFEEVDAWEGNKGAEEDG